MRGDPHPGLGWGRSAPLRTAPRRQLTHGRARNVGREGASNAAVPRGDGWVARRTPGAEYGLGRNEGRKSDHGLYGVCVQNR